MSYLEKRFMDLVVGQVVEKTEKVGMITTITFRSGRLLILTDGGLSIRFRASPPLVIG
jgi:hypothetical protein